MITIRARNAEDALFTALLRLKLDHEEAQSRNGTVYRFREPVTTIYERPLERVIFDSTRNCNPFLHFFESLWMLSGSGEVEFLLQFAKNMDQFSDDGKTLNGAYGHRWRFHFGYDQLGEVIQLLKNDPSSRRAVVGIWDPWADLKNQFSKDLPCNTQVMFKIRGGGLDMTVLNRSNDMIWGAYGANVVHFSYLQEYMAGALNVSVGVYRQVSDDLHLYPGIPVAEKMWNMAGANPVNHYGLDPGMALGPRLLEESEPWELHSDLQRMIEDPTARRWDPLTPFYDYVGKHMARIHRAFKSGDVNEMCDNLNCLRDRAWEKACREWIDRIRIARGEPLLPPS
jgi:hypothetical protein